jgi:hypothetical protein
MKLSTKIAVILGALMLAMAPAVALTTQPTDPGDGNGPKYASEKPEKETPSAGRLAARKGEGLRRLLSGPEQETRGQSERDAVQPVRRHDGEDRP